MSKYNIKYRTLDSLMEDVADDFYKYDENSLIDRSSLIKVVQRINSDLGIKINQEKEDIVSVVRGKGELPSDFYILNYALLCTKYKVKRDVTLGRHTENVEIDLCQFQPNPCLPYTCSNLKHCNPYEIKEKRSIETVEFTEVDVLCLKNSRKQCEDGCPNLSSKSINEAMIKDGYIVTNFDEGKIYINYTGLMEDGEGNLVVLDHPLINEYYEYALKERILENIYINGDDTVVQKLGLIQQKLREAKTIAFNIVKMPEYSELRDIWVANRLRYKRKYEDIIL